MVLWGPPRIGRSVCDFGAFVCGKVRPIEWFKDGFEIKVMVFEAQMGRTVKADFDKDGVFWTDSDGLIFEDLKELIVKAEGEVVGEGSICAEGKDFLKPV